MPHQGTPVHLAVVDNWMLQLACEVLDRGISGDQDELWHRCYSGYGHSTWEFYEALPPEERDWDSFTRNHLEALLQVLDVIVLYDRIAHDRDRSFIWKQSQALQPISKILKPVRTTSAVQTALRDILAERRRQQNQEPETWNVSVSGTGPKSRYIGGGDPFFESPGDLGTQDRTFYYLVLALHTGAAYWPAPARAAFLKSQIYQESERNFVLMFREHVDSELAKTVQQIQAMMGGRAEELLFPGFGAAILAHCDSPASLLSSALELRDSRPARSFREWLRQMEHAVASADCRMIARELGSVRDVMAEMRQEMGITPRRDEDVELEIGLSPSITVGAGTLRSLLGRLKPKPGHLVFIRKHFERVLSRAEVGQHIARLFPSLGQHTESFFHRRLAGARFR